GSAESMECHLGDFTEYMGLRQAISDREAELSRARSRAQRDAVANLAAELRRGDVIQVPSGRRSGYAGVAETPGPPGLDGPVVSVVTAEGRLRKLSGGELPYGTRAVTRLRVPKSFNPRKPAERRDVSSAMRSALGALAHDDPSAATKERAKMPSTAATDAERARLKKERRAHPSHGCADREEHARWFKRWEKLRRERDQGMRRIEGRTSSIARDFDKVCDV